MTRRRWAGAWVLLLATVLLNLRTPGPPLDTAVRTVAAAQAAPTVAAEFVMAAEPTEPLAGTAGPAAHGAGDTGDETRTGPGPCEDGTAGHRAVPRPARTPGAAGAPLRQSATDADGTGHRSAVTAVRQAPAAPPPATALLRTYRC